MRFLFIGMALVAWEAAARSGLWNKILFPSLVNIGQELVLFFTRTASLMEVWTSLYRALGWGPGQFPHAERIGSAIVTLPLFPAMADEDVDRVCEAARQALT